MIEAKYKPRRGEQISGMQKLVQLLHDDAARPSLMGDVQPLINDPARLFAPMNVVPDPWQVEVLKSVAPKVLLLCSRQSGKSFVMSAMAILEALTHPFAEVLIISKTLRQSTELLLKVKMLWRGLIGGRVHRRTWQPKSLLESTLIDGARIKDLGWDGAALINAETVGQVRDKALSMDFPNGSRITSLPGNPDTIVGFSAVTLLIIDEAARVSDALYNLVRPFLAASEAVHGRAGRMVVASTPFGKRGWFHEAWQNCEKASQAYLRGVDEQGKATDRVTAGTGQAGDSGRDQRTWAGRDRGDAQGADNHAGHHRQAARIEASQGHRSVPPAGPYSGEDGWLNAHWRLGYEGQEAKPPFQAFRVTADQCPRITKEFLEEERAMIGDRWFQQEYGTLFVDAVDSVFSADKIDAMVKPGDGELMLYFE